MTHPGYPDGIPDAEAPEPRLVRAVLDANVIYPAFLRDVLLRLAASDLYLPHWTARIHDEWIRNVLLNRPHLSAAALERTRANMDAHFSGALVVEFEDLERYFGGVHPGDQHVAAAALKAGADRIITHNLKHFRANALQPYGITAQHPDDFVCELILADAVTARGTLQRHRAGLNQPPYTPAEYTEAFVRAGLPKAARLLGP